MLRFERFRASDMAVVEPQDMQLVETAILTPGVADNLASHLAFSAWDGGECVICSGILPINAHRGLVWALVAKSARRHLTALTRFSRQVFDDYPIKRLEATILPEFRNAQRWITMLGFEYEATIECYDELGRTIMMYKRIRA